MEAEKPFDSTALADTVLRSSDNVHFYVLGAFLRYVSPTFRDLFSLSRGSAADENETKDGYPVLPLPEDSMTIQYLLVIIHPSINKPKLLDSRLLIKVWKVAEKYGMDMVLGKLQKRLLKDYKTHKVFAIAIICGWKDGAESAKQKLASHSLWEEVPYCDEFQDISGTDYYGLLEYRFRRSGKGKVVDDGIEASVSVGDNLPVDSAHSTSPEVNIRDASEPFDSSSKANIILRSSDGVDFYVSGPLLRLMSSAFDGPFSDDAKGESKNDLTVVRVRDHSNALHHFLLALHQPMNNLPVENPGLIADICMVARNYHMLIVEARLKEQLAASSSLVDKPLRVYAIATALGWKDIARAAAKNTLNTPLEETVTCVPELQRITGADLFRLIDYRAKCAKAASEVIGNNRLHRFSGPGSLASHFVRQTRSPSESVEQRLAACPRGSTYKNIFAQSFELIEKRHADQSWSISSSAKYVRCFRDIPEAIEQGVDKVTLADAITE